MILGLFLLALALPPETISMRRERERGEAFMAPILRTYMTFDEIELEIAGIPPESIIFMKTTEDASEEVISALARSLDRLYRDTGVKILFVPYNVDLYRLGAVKMEKSL